MHTLAKRKYYQHARTSHASRLICERQSDIRNLMCLHVCMFSIYARIFFVSLPLSTHFAEVFHISILLHIALFLRVHSPHLIRILHRLHVFLRVSLPSLFSYFSFLIFHRIINFIYSNENEGKKVELKIKIKHHKKHTHTQNEKSERASTYIKTSKIIMKASGKRRKLGKGERERERVENEI